VIASLNALLGQNKKFRPPSVADWSCNAPADQVLKWMVEKGLPVDLFQNGAALALFLRLPENARAAKKAGIHLAYPPHPGKTDPSAPTKMVIRVERGDPNVYQRQDI
jgi:hypothetical protein